MNDLETFEQLETYVRVLGEQNLALGLFFDTEYNGKIKYSVEIMAENPDNYTEFHGKTLRECLQKCISSPIFKTLSDGLTS